MSRNPKPRRTSLDGRRSSRVSTTSTTRPTGINGAPVGHDPPDPVGIEGVEEPLADAGEHRQHRPRGRPQRPRRRSRTRPSELYSGDAEPSPTCDPRAGPRGLLQPVEQGLALLLACLPSRRTGAWKGHRDVGSGRRTPAGRLSAEQLGEKLVLTGLCAMGSGLAGRGRLGGNLGAVDGFEPNPITPPLRACRAVWVAGPALGEKLELLVDLEPPSAERTVGHDVVDVDVDVRRRRTTWKTCTSAPRGDRCWSGHNVGLSDDPQRTWRSASSPSVTWHL